MSYNIVGNMAPQPNAWKGHKMHQISMFSGLKFHVFTPHSDAFSRFLGSFAQNRFSLFDANLEGIV